MVGRGGGINLLLSSCTTQFSFLPLHGTEVLKMINLNATLSYLTAKIQYAKTYNQI